MARAKLSCGPGGIGRFQVQDGHLRAMRRQHARRGKAQAIEAGAAGNDGNAVF